MLIPFFKEIENSNSILISGAGGGFDIASGIPLYIYLRSKGKKVYLANLSFTHLPSTASEKVFDELYKITEESLNTHYFPEKYILDWLHSLNEYPDFFAFSSEIGVAPLTSIYTHLRDSLNIDTLILIDGGTDSLMFGDESKVGTIVEDACSIVAATKANIEKCFVAAIGFGVEHDFNHHSCLENMSTLIESDGYLGAISITKDMPEGKAYLDMVEHLNNAMPLHQSIVVNSIYSAMTGKFGDYHSTNRTAGSIQFISALMPIMWFFDTRKIASHLSFLSLIENTETMYDVASEIQMHRLKNKTRAHKKIPIN